MERRLVREVELGRYGLYSCRSWLRELERLEGWEMGSWGGWAE